MKKYTLLSCALSVLLSGCGALPKNDPPRSFAGIAKHVISVDRDGRLKIIENDEVKDTVACNSNSKGKTEENRRCDGYLDGVIKGIEEFKSGKQNAEVLFFIHGGLNKPEEYLERAKKQLALIHDDGKYNNIYPIFVIWDSRGPSSYTEHLWSIRQGEESKTAPFSSPFYLMTDIGNSIINAPKSWLVNGKHMWLSVTKNIQEKETELRSDITKSGVGPMMSYSEKNYNSKNLFRRMRWILGSPSKAVVTPFAYTMGRPAWDIMLRRTNTLFYTPEDLKLQDEDVKKSALPVRQPGSGALYSLLEKLKDEKEDIKITLVGHSMGAIVVNKMLILEPELPYKNIVHMASADSINNLFNTVVPYVTKSNVKFYSLMLHPDNEDREEAWGGLVPSGSLLTWIDNMYTSPETVLDKRSGRWDNIKSSIKFLPNEAANNMRFKIFGLSIDKDPAKIVPQKHGDFDEMRFWDKTTWE